MARKPMDYAEKIPISEYPIKFKFEGIFDFDGLYLATQTWLAKRGYEFHESQYKHKPGELPGTREVEHRWFAEKKISGYLMNLVNISFHLWNVNEVEIKGKLWTQARMEMLIRPTLILDYEEKWGKNAFYAFLRDFFHKHIVKEKIDHVWGENLRLEALDLLEFTKKYLSSYAQGKVY